MSGFNDGLKKPVSGGGGAAAETVDLIAGETITAGQLVYQSHGATGTQGRVYLTDSDSTYSSNKAAVIGVATNGVEAAGTTVTVQYTGVATVSSTLVAGKVYSPSSTPGELAANGEEPMIGVAESTTELRLTGTHTTTGLTAGVAYGASGSGVLTAGQDESIGYAISSTELLIRGQYGATEPLASLFDPAPLVYWRWNADTGATATDSSGNGYNGTMPAGSYSYSSQTIGSASPRTVLQYTAVTDGGIPLPALSAPPGNDRTISFWHRPSNLSTYDYLFTNVAPDGTGTPGNGLWLRRASTNLTHQGFKQGTERYGTKVLDTAEWFHYCLVIQGGTGTLYVSKVGTDTTPQVVVTGGISARARPDGAGENMFANYLGNASTTYQAQGYFADFAMFDAAIPATGDNSVESLYNGGVIPDLK